MKIADIFRAYLYIFKLMLKFETRFFVMRKCFYKITAAFISIMTPSADIPLVQKIAPKLQNANLGAGYVYVVIGTTVIKPVFPRAP